MLKCLKNVKINFGVTLVLLKYSVVLKIYGELKPITLFSNYAL
jgi:hypothetical protein